MTTTREKKFENEWMGMYTVDNYIYSSRNPIGEQFMDGKTKADAVEIIAQRAKCGRLVVIKNNNRPPVGRPVYEFPAGCLEPTERTLEAAEREFKEETGMDLMPHSVQLRSFKSAGFGDETTALVMGFCNGDPSADFQEENEDIEVVLMKPAELKKLAQDANSPNGPLLTTTLALYIQLLSFHR